LSSDEFNNIDESDALFETGNDNADADDDIGSANL
jgi:hypothetical protein